MTDTQETGTPYTTVSLDNPMRHDICGAKTRKGTPCQTPPVTGKARCRMHGGSEGSGRPPIHGLYSKSLRASLAEKYSAFLGDPDYKSLTSELAMGRALLADYLSRFVDGVALPAADIERLTNLIDKIGRLAERANRIECRSALTGRELDLLSVIIVRELTADLGREKALAFWTRVVEGAFGMDALLPAPQIIDHETKRG